VTQILIGSFKINCIHSGAVLNIGDVIFNLPSNKIQLSAGSNSFYAGDGTISIAPKEPENSGGEIKRKFIKQ